MRTRCLASGVVLALSAATVATSQTPSPQEIPTLILGEHSTFSPFPGPAMEKGAVYELRLRVPWAKMGDYMEHYARWYMPIDASPASSRAPLPYGGRKLLTVLAREHGDQYNIVFLYWYESAYKEDYYCKFAKAFFEHHHKAVATKDALDTFYDAALKSLNSNKPIGKTIAELGSCKANQPPLEAAETIRQIDQKQRAMEDLSEATWNFGFNPCRAVNLHDPSQCGISVLEKATGMKPDSKQPPPR
jgi:hypothetical protein